MSLYLQDPYRRKMKIRLTNIVHSKGYSHFFLEDSIVTPAISNYTKGDLATINGEILQVDLDQKGNAKFMAKNISEDQEVEIEIDWSNRLQMMQNNLARIILRICLHELEGLVPTFESTEDQPYFLLPVSDFGFQSLENLEDLANRLIQSNLPISYPPGSNSRVRIAGYQEEDSFGPKLNSTGECSILLLSNIERHEEGIKLFYHCGNQAIQNYKRHRALARNLGIFFHSDDPGHIWSEVKKLKQQIEDLKSDKKKLESELGLEEINEFLSHKRLIGEVSYIYRVLSQVNFKNLKNLIQAIQQKKKHIQIYGIPNGNEAQIIVATSSDLPLNVKKTMDEIAKRYKLEGSGNLYRIQANCPIYSMKDVMDEFLLSFQASLAEK